MQGKSTNPRNRFLVPPSSKSFADAVKHYREVFSPRMLRDSTFSTADSHLKNHLEPDWKDVAVDHITIDTINDWAWKKKRKRGGPLVENSVLVQGLHPALKKLGLQKSGMHAFRRGCNRRWELARVSAAVIRQQMGHASASMTAHYTGEIPVEVVKNFLQLDSNEAAKAA
jgi:integrase